MYTQKKINIKNAYINSIEFKKADYIDDIKYKNLGLDENCAILLTVYKTTLEKIKSLSFYGSIISYEEQAILKNSIISLENEIMTIYNEDLYKCYQVSDYQTNSKNCLAVFNLKLSNLLNEDTSNIELKIKEIINHNITWSIPTFKIKSIDSIEALKNIAIMMPFFSRYSEHELDKIINNLICRL